MKKLACCIAVSVIIAICTPAWPQNAKPTEGGQPYVLTRLEWLALDLNATLRVDSMFSDSKFSMSFLGDSAKDTLIIVVRYWPTVDREMMNREIEFAKKVTSKTAEVNGWSSWLKIKEQVEMIKPK